MELIEAGVTEEDLMAIREIGGMSRMVTASLATCERIRCRETLKFS